MERERLAVAYDKKYSDKECEEMIRTGTYPVDAPPFVIKEIRKKRRGLDREVKSPDKEMDDFMKEHGGSKIVRE